MPWSFIIEFIYYHVRCSLTVCLNLCYIYQCRNGYWWDSFLNNNLVVQKYIWIKITIYETIYFSSHLPFSVAGPTLWIALSKNVQLYATLAEFESSLKTYIFTKAYTVLLCTLLIYFTSDLFLLFTLILYLYNFIVSGASVTSHNGMLYFNTVSQLYNSYISYCLVCFIYILRTALENIAVRCYINQ